MGDPVSSSMKPSIFTRLIAGTGRGIPALESLFTRYKLLEIERITYCQLAMSMSSSRASDVINSLHITMDGTYEQASHVTFFLPSSRHATEHITRSGCPMTTGAASSWASAIMAVRMCPCSATCLAMQTMQALDGWQRCMLSAGTSPMAAGGLRCAWAPCEVVRMRPHAVLTALDV
jgi:hypothetical protein